MTYTTAEAQRRLLDSLAQAVAEIAAALAALGEAYEQLDEHAADRLEAELFRPVRRAYARARHAYAEFAQRSALPVAEPQAPGRLAPSHGAQGFVEQAVDASARADLQLAELQDSLLPVEVGDAQLRAALSAVRELLSEVAPAAREMLRTLGR